MTTNMSARYSATMMKGNEGGFVAQCIEVPGAIAQGSTKAEALESLRLTIEALVKAQRKVTRANGSKVIYL